ncbi:MAG: TraR/DksA C4-type zinc finger protein [Gemmatimonadota bacterium]|jgi:DnaK suppressor protein
MDHLTDDQLTELRDELERQLARLERSMELTDEAARPVELDQQAVGRLSRMDSLISQGMAQKLQDRERARLSALLDAFRRLEEGAYGVCSTCDGPIPFGRLAIVPETSTCAACSDA